MPERTVERLEEVGDGAMRYPQVVEREPRILLHNPKELPGKEIPAHIVRYTYPGLDTRVQKTVAAKVCG